MKRYSLLVLTCMVAACSAFAVPALATPRAPQIPFGSASLQTRLNSLGESILVGTQQQDGLVWGTTISSNSTLTIQFDLNGNPSADEVGIAKLNATGNAITGLVPLFPASSDSGFFAVASFRPGGTLTVTLFNQHAAVIAMASYTGVNRSLFAYYIKRTGGGTFYSHDGFNSDGKAHALAYAGTGANTGSWWLCWEDASIANYPDADFDDAIVFMESLNPTGVSRSTWGAVKARFR